VASGKKTELDAALARHVVSNLAGKRAVLISQLPPHLSSIALGFASKHPLNEDLSLCERDFEPQALDTHIQAVRMLNRDSKRSENFLIASGVQAAR